MMNSIISRFKFTGIIIRLRNMTWHKYDLNFTIEKRRYCFQFQPPDHYGRYREERIARLRPVSMAGYITVQSMLYVYAIGLLFDVSRSDTKIHFGLCNVDYPQHFIRFDTDCRCSSFEVFKTVYIPSAKESFVMTDQPETFQTIFSTIKMRLYKKLFEIVVCDVILAM